MEDEQKNNSKNLKNQKEEDETNIETEIFPDGINIKEFNSKDINFKFNIYTKGKSLSRQLSKLKNNFSNFIYHLSFDSNTKNQTINTKTKTNLKLSKKANLKLKLDSSSNLKTLPSLREDKNIKLKKVSFTIPKTKNESKIATYKTSKQKTLYKSIQFRTNNLNKLYGYNEKFNTLKDTIKKHKYTELEKYQDDILRLSSMNLCRDNLLKLYSDLRSIRINSNKVKPLPPINFISLINHSLNKNKKTKNRGFLPRNKKYQDMDEYEKELYNIKKNSKPEKIHTNNRTLYKMYEILPEHLVDKIYVKKRKF